MNPRGVNIDTPLRLNQNVTGMTLKTLREMRDVAPFKPFDIHLADGQTLTVITPDHLFFMPNSAEFLVVFRDGGFRFVDARQVVSAGRSSARAKAH